MEPLLEALDPVLHIGALVEPGLGLERPALVQRVAQLDRVDRLDDRDAVAHEQVRREVLAEDDRRVVVAGLLNAHLVEADAGAEAAEQQSAAPHARLCAARSSDAASPDCSVLIERPVSR
jgi:hypothetical protein